MPLTKKKKFKPGKIKRHKLRKALGVKNGFGKSWSAPSVIFRVEFSWENIDGSEENEQIHWIECRKFQGKEREFLKTHYTQSTEEWTDGESIESKFICVYCAYFLTQRRQEAEGRWQKFFQDKGYPKMEIPKLADYKFNFDEQQQLAIAQNSEHTPKHFIDFPSTLCPLPSAFVLNQAFVFPTPKKGNETIRFPIYQIKWTQELASNSVFNENLAIVMKNSIWHKYY